MEICRKRSLARNLYAIDDAFSLAAQTSGSLEEAQQRLLAFLRQYALHERAGT